MDLSGSLKAVGDESRLRLIAVLARGSFTVQELTNILGLSQPTVSHHLKTLQQAELVRTRKEGTWNIASLSEASGDSPSAKLLDCVLDLLKTGANGQTPALERDSAAVDDALAARRDRAHAWFESVAPRWREVRDAAVGAAPSNLDELADLIPDTGTVLELGCGSGALLERIAPRKGPTIGVDYSQAMLSEARRALGPRAGNIDLRLGYLEHLPLPDRSVDLAVACMVMHHVADPREVFREVRRVLNSGGVFLISDLVRHDDERMRERGGDLWLGFEPNEFCGWLEECGFSVRSCELRGEKQSAFTVKAEAVSI